MTRLPDTEALHRARALYETQVDATDATTRTALQARRRAALARLEARPAIRWWMPAGGLATAAVALALVLPRMDGPAAPVPDRTVAQPQPEAGISQAADSALLAEGATLELENDAEFYAWLAEAPAEDGDDALPITDGTAAPSADPQEGWTL